MDQLNKAGPESHPAEAPKRRRGAQPGNNNARRKATPAAAVPPPANVIGLKPKRARKAKTPPDCHIDGIADRVPPQDATDRHDAATPKRKRGAPKGSTNAKAEKKLAAAMAETQVKFEEPPKKKMGRPRTRPERDPGPLRMGRPPAIEVNDETIRRLTLLAKLRSTEEEAAAHFDVSLPTFRNFLATNKKAEDSWTKGRFQFNTSLRSKQIELANAGSVPMLIWLGKQFLDQRDKHEHSGDSERPIKGEMMFKVEFVKNGATYENSAS